MSNFFLFLCACSMLHALAEDSDTSYFAPKDDGQCSGDSCQDVPAEINILFIFTNVESPKGHRLKKSFRLTANSMLKHATVPLKIHIVGDEESQKVAAQILEEENSSSKAAYTLVTLTVDSILDKVGDIVKPIKEHFVKKPGLFSDVLFFLSVAIHKALPSDMHKIIMMDVDLKFKTDIKELYELFDMFTEDNIMGIAREAQPVYRHLFGRYRKEHPGTRVGDPPPKGLTGFNSGVLLLDLDRMRNSALYKSYLTASACESLTTEFKFINHHLGDQDFFTALGMKHERLFYFLPCEWNRQLNRWWEDKGWQDVFHLYFNCDAPVKIYHGNGDSQIPDD